MPLDGTQFDETTRVLVDAADLLRAGWCVRSRQEGTSFCALGALSFAATGDAYATNDAYHAAYQRLAATLTPDQIESAHQEATRHGWLALDLDPEGLVAQFNNSQTSVEPILAWFDRAFASVCALSGSA